MPAPRVVCAVDGDGEPRTSIGSSREMSRCVTGGIHIRAYQKREIRLEECAVHPRSLQPLEIAVFALKGCVFVISAAERTVSPIRSGPVHLVDCRHVTTSELRSL